MFRRFWTHRFGALIALGLICIAGLASGCGGDDSKDETATSGGGQSAKVEGTLSLWEVAAAPRENQWWKQLAADFHAKYPDATVEVSPYGTQDYFTKKQAAFSSGDEPDISLVSGPGEEIFQFVRAGKLAPLDDLAPVDQFQRGHLDAYRAGDGNELYAVPISLTVISMWYNKGLFADNGLDVPKTWDDLKAACTKLRSAGVTPIALGVGGQDAWTAAHLFDSIAYQYGGRTGTLDATYGTDGASWKGEPIVQAATSFKDLVDTKCFSDGAAGLNYGQMSSQFLRGDAAMIFTGTWFPGELQSTKSKLDVGLIPLPDAPGGSHSTANQDGVLGAEEGMQVSKRAADEKPELVKAFLQFLADRADDFANFNDKVSVVAQPKPTRNALAQEATDLSKATKEFVAPTDVTLPGYIYDSYYTNLQGLVRGDSPEKFTSAMEEAVESDRSRLPESATG